MNSVNFSNFKPSAKLKVDSEDEFKKYLRDYIYNWVINTSTDSNLARK
jgi:hypothetical protein